MIQNGPQVVKAIGNTVDVDTVTVPKNSVAYSTPWTLVDVASFGLQYQVACTGTPSVKIEIQQSVDNSNWFDPDNMADIVADITDKSLHGCRVSPIVSQYMRFKLTELTNTVEDTVVSLKFSAQKRFAS